VKEPIGWTSQVKANCASTSTAFHQNVDEMKSMDSFARLGANHSDAPWHHANLQRRMASEDEIHVSVLVKRSTRHQRLSVVFPTAGRLHLTRMTVPNSGRQRRCPQSCGVRP
jgi:hypothetical protein